MADPVKFVAGPQPRGPVDDTALSQFAEIGVSGLKVYSGILNEEFLRQLQGERGRRVFREMSQNDATIGAVLAALGLMIRGVKWRAEPADESEKAKAEAEFAESLFKDMSHTWEDFVAEVLSMLTYGWAYHEIVFKNRVGPEETSPEKRSAFTDGRIGVRKLAPRGQETLSRWDMQDDGGINGMWQLPPIVTGVAKKQNSISETLIPIERALLFRTTSRLNSPEGVSILRTAYESWYFLKRIREYEAIGIERELAGLPVVRIPSRYTKSTATDAEKALYEQCKQLARDVKFNSQAGVVLPSDPYYDSDGRAMGGVRQVDLELLKGGGTRTINTTEVKNDYKRDITRTVLADFLMLGQDKGAFNLSESKADLFLRAIEAVCSQIAAPLNLYLLPRVWALNGLPYETMPKMVSEPIMPADLAKLGAFLQQAAGAGMPLFPDETLESYIRAQADLPEKSPEALQAQKDQQEIDQQHADLGLQQRQQQVDGTAPGQQDGGGDNKDGGGDQPPPGVKKFNEFHDELGQFAESGSGRHFGAAFVSPAVVNHDFNGAIADMHGARHDYVMQASHDVDEALGLHADTASVVGAWRDGAENSTMSRVEGASWDDLKTAAAMKGYIANQKQALVFQEANEGDSFLSNFEAKGSLSEIHQNLLDRGLEFHTLEPHAGGATVHIFGQDDATAKAVTEAGAHYGSKVTTRIGRGEFIGTQKQDGTDEEQRADARKVYSGLISGSRSRGAGAAWDRLRNRYAGADAVKAIIEEAVLAVFEKYNAYHDEHSGQFTFAGQGSMGGSGSPFAYGHKPLGNKPKWHPARIKAALKNPKVKKALLHAAGAAAMSTALLGLEAAGVHGAAEFALHHFGLAAAAGGMLGPVVEGVITHTVHSLGITPEHAQEWLSHTFTHVLTNAKHIIHKSVAQPEVEDETPLEIDADTAEFLRAVIAAIDAWKPRGGGEGDRPFDKFNENHDDAGRFASASGGGGGAKGDASDLSYSSLRTMPSEIEGVSIEKKAMGGPYLAIGGSSGIAVNTSRKAGAAWKDMAAYQKKAFDAGWSSSDHPNHVIWHELAHVKTKNDPDVNDSYLTNLRAGSNPHFKEVAQKVSKYAATNGHEFVAEVYARRGKKVQ
jgi:hypothetical protein